MGYKQIQPDDLVISTDSVTGTVWSANNPTLTTFFTSSTQVSANTGKYYYNIYNTASTISTSEVQFGISYGNKDGSGSSWYNILVTGSSPTKTMYGQYRNLILADENAPFVFGNFTSSDFYAISVERSRYKEKFLPGTMTMVLSGSGGKLYLTDDSLVASSIIFKDAGRVYNIVSGSAGSVYTGINSTGYAGGAGAASGSYGWFLPDIGTILLNPSALGGAVAAGGLLMTTLKNSNTDDNNPGKLFTAISGGASFLLNSEETISSVYSFVRIKNSEFNYSENPSFISGSTGAVLYDSFINSPQTYITAVGLYNDSNELLAIAKLSRPLVKDFVREALLRIKLDF